MKKAITILVFLFGVWYNAQYTRQPREYGDYVQPYNLELLNKTLSQKQSNYNNNYNVVNRYSEDLRTLIKIKIKYVKLTESHYKYLDNVLSTIEYIQKVDLSSNSTAAQVISYLKDAYSEIDSW